MVAARKIIRPMVVLAVRGRNGRWRLSGGCCRGCFWFRQNRWNRFAWTPQRSFQDEGSTFDDSQRDVGVEGLKVFLRHFLLLWNQLTPARENSIKGPHGKNPAHLDEHAGHVKILPRQMFVGPPGHSSALGSFVEAEDLEAHVKTEARHKDVQLVRAAVGMSRVLHVVREALLVTMKNVVTNLPDDIGMVRHVLTGNASDLGSINLHLAMHVCVGCLGDEVVYTVFLWNLKALQSKSKYKAYI